MNIKLFKMQSIVKNRKLYFIIFITIFFFSYIRIFDLDKYPGINADESWMANKAYYIANTSLIENFKGMDNYTGILTPAIMCFMGKILSFDHYSMRLISVLFAYFTIILTFLICSKLYSDILAAIASLLLSVSVYFVSYSRVAVPHIWITPFLIISFYLLSRFINQDKKQKYLLGAVVFLIALAVQLHPPPIIFLIFTLIILVKKKTLLGIYKNKYFPIFILLFVIGTSSMFIYTFRIILKIIKMNFGYISKFGYINIFQTILERLPVYFKVLFTTLSGWRSINYFSGAVNLENEWFFVIIGIVFLLPFILLYRSKKINDRLIFKYLIINILILPFFLEFFNKNMHMPHLGEERYFMILYPFIIIGSVRGWQFMLERRKIVFYIVMLIFVIFNIYMFQKKYINVFQYYGGISGNKLVRYIYAVNKKPVTGEIWDYINADNFELKKDIFIAPSFWMYHPLKFYSLSKIENFYFWPEKAIPKIWITDNKYKPYKYATTGWNNFINIFKNKPVYFITFTDSREKYYMDRIIKLKIKYKIIKSFYNKDRDITARIYRLSI